jgi:peptide/nickel transport system substrate-binding protein
MASGKRQRVLTLQVPPCTAMRNKAVKMIQKIVDARRWRDSAAFSLVQVLVAVVALGVVGAVAIFVISDSDTKEQAGDVAPETNITRGGALVVAISATSGVLNPATTSNGGVHTNSEAMFNGLVGWSPENAATPELAEKWSITDGGAKAEFTLRPGMTWHDGKPITADDVKFTFEESLLRYHSRTVASMGPALGVTGSGNAAVVPPTAIELPDGPTGLKIRFNFLYPYAPLLRQMNVTEAPIIPKHVYQPCSVAAMGATAATLGNQSGAICEANNTPVGSGPFMYSARDATKIEVVRNPKYFRAEQPYLDKVVYLVAPPGAATTTALKAPRNQPGSIDVGNIPGSETPSFQNNADYKVAEVPRGTGGGNCIMTLAYNLWPNGMTADAIKAKPANAPYEHPILKNLAVRNAIALAFNRQAAFDKIDFGRGRLADSPYHSALDATYAKQTLPSYDPVKAGATLAEAGWIEKSPGEVRVSDGRAGLPKAGTPLAIDHHHFDTGTQLDYGLQFKADLRQVGIEVTDMPRTSALQQTDLATRAYDTSWISYCDGDDPAIGARRQYVSSLITPVAFTNVSGYRNQKVTDGDGSMDDLWDRSAKSTGAQYKELHGKIQAKAVADLPQFWATETVNLRVTRSVCSGFNDNNTGLFVEGAHCQP